jgi:predicted nicotinamide N-methyase
MSDLPFDSVIRIVCGLSLQIPDPQQVEHVYRSAGGQMPFPYWSRLWPSGIALAQWLMAEPERVEGRSVLELGAGLGLPSLVAAPYAKHLVISDHIPEALTWMDHNLRALGLENVECQLINWHHHPIPRADVILMSDVGYDPSDFDRLQDLVSKQLETGGSILLAVPERSISVVFIEMLEEFSHSRKVVAVEEVRIILFAFTGVQIVAPKF